jgi:hypothetical protein
MDGVRSGGGAGESATWPLEDLMEVDGPGAAPSTVQPHENQDFDYDAALGEAYALLTDENQPRPGPSVTAAGRASAISVNPSEWGRSPSPEAATGNAPRLSPGASRSPFAESPLSPTGSTPADFLPESYQLPQEQAAQASPDGESGERSLFGANPPGSPIDIEPGSPVDPGHGLALPSAAGSITRLPGASFPAGDGPGRSGSPSGRQSLATTLNARRYNPYGPSASAGAATGSEGSSRLAPPRRGRTEKTNGPSEQPPQRSRDDVRRANEMTASLRPPRRAVPQQPSSATGGSVSVGSSAQAGSSPSASRAPAPQVNYVSDTGKAVTVYQHASGQDQTMMEKLGGYQRGEDNENNVYLITPEGKAYEVKESRGSGYSPQARSALKGLIAAVEQTGFTLGTVSTLFGRNTSWLPQVKNKRI